jgi:endoglucanase
MDTRPDEHLPRLVGLWRQIAARYKHRPARVYFELLNEPHGKLTEDKWNAAIPRLLAAVRETNPTRPVIAGPGQWNAVRGLDRLQLPDDRNLIVTVHFYDPFEFTHQGASWVNGSDRWKGRKWPRTDAEEAAVRTALGKAAAWAKKHDRPVFLGEFGAFQVADTDSRARWTRFVAREAERLGFSWAYWELCAGFGAYDPRAGTWREPLKAALLRRPSEPRPRRSRDRQGAGSTSPRSLTLAARTSQGFPASVIFRRSAERSSRTGASFSSSARFFCSCGSASWSNSTAPPLPPFHSA